MGYGARGLTLGLSGGGVSLRTNLTAAARRADRERETAARIAQAEAIEADRIRRLGEVRVQLHDDAGLTVLDQQGGIVVGDDLDFVWAQLGPQIMDLLDRGVARINAEAEPLIAIHLDTPHPAASEPPARVAFDEPEPGQSVLMPPPILDEPAALGWLARRFAGRRERHQAAVNEARRLHASQHSDWKEGVAVATEAHERDVADWHARRTAHEATEIERTALLKHAIRFNPEAMERELIERLEALVWPRETIVGVEVSSDGKMADLDVDLPEIEDMPGRVASRAPSRREITIKTKSERALRMEYARHVHGVLFRLAGHAFAALPGIERVIVSGYSQRLNKAIGSVEDQYLVSADIDRDGWGLISFDRLADVDPVEALAAFPIRRMMTSTGLFKPIERFKSRS